MAGNTSRLPSERQTSVSYIEDDGVMYEVKWTVLITLEGIQTESHSIRRLNVRKPT